MAVEKILKDISLYLRDIRNELVKMNEKEITFKTDLKTIEKEQTTEMLTALSMRALDDNFPTKEDREVIKKLADLGTVNAACPSDIRIGVDLRGATREPR